MTRKLLVKIIAALFILQGIAWIVNFCLQMFTPQSTILLNNIISGIVMLWAGIYLFQISEFGRKFALLILYFNAVWSGINGVIDLLFPLFDSRFCVVFWISIYNERIFESKNPYLSAIFLFTWTIITLATIFLLTHKKTRALFVSQTTKTEDASPLSKSTSQQ